MLEFAGVGKEDLLYDMGSGDGRIVIMAAEEFGAKSVGIEADPFRAAWSRFSIWKRKLQGKAKIIRQNFFKTTLEDATVVTLYQGYEINKKIREKLSSELKPGTRVVSYRFVLDGWVPRKVDKEASLYLYVV
ncbi:MAG: SAM-dependent methyltransferase [Candidatus Thorarchaeota archaeon]|nr:SAM-dependent methyltransferase [Candidatus Thorarchaeota archaeon]